MKKSVLWTTIVESIIVMMIIVIWVIWAYNIFSKSIDIISSTDYKLKAISIAREWIEAITNIRDTNWLLYQANRENCWLTYNYDAGCVIYNNKYVPPWSYVLYNWPWNKFYLSWVTSIGVWFDNNYKNDFRVKTLSWFYTQSWGININPVFTREIKISYKPWTPPQEASIESIVRWDDNSSSNYHEVKLETSLTNWKKD